MNMYNLTNNINGSNMYDLWVVKGLYSKPCDSESDYPWQNMWKRKCGMSAIRDKPRKYELDWNKKNRDDDE
jgi:hypothetical protein